MTTDAYPVERGLPLPRRGTRLPGRGDRRPGAGDALRGTLFRNGSGRNELAGEWFPHWFDGDGMISAIRFDDNGIHYPQPLRRAPRTTATRRAPAASSIAASARCGRAACSPTPSASRPTSPTPRSSWRATGCCRCGKAARPSRSIRRPSRRAASRTSAARSKAFSAHPEDRPRHRRAVQFRHRLRRQQHAHALPHGTRASDALAAGQAALSGDEPRFRADEELSRRSASGPILVHPLKFLLGLQSFDGALRLGRRKADPDPAACRATARGTPRFIETDAFFQFHFANGFEEDGALVLDLARYPDYATIGQALRNYWHSDWPADGMAALTRLRIDLSTGKVERRDFDTGTANEFPASIPACRQAPPLRLYRLQSRPTGRRLAAAARRVDLETGAVVRHDFGPDGYPGEPLFIPPRAAAPRMTAWWSRWCSMPRASAPTSSASTRATSRREPLFVGAAQASCAVLAARHLHAAAVLARGALQALLSVLGLSGIPGISGRASGVPLKATPLSVGPAQQTQPGPTTISRTLVCESDQR